MVRTYDEWRDRVRPWLASRVASSDIDWTHFERRGALALEHALSESAIRLPRELVQRLQCISNYRDDSRWELMYRLAWRSLYENRRLLEDGADRDVRHSLLMERAIRRDCHKMHAFVRFRESLDETGRSVWFAWFEPDHEILRRGTPFFAKRFPNMHWTIATPDGSAMCSDGQVTYLDAPAQKHGPRHDAQEDLWRTYYRSICNVARINPRVMQREMPQKYWCNLPEAAEIPSLVRDGMANFAVRHRERDDLAIDEALAVRAALDALPRIEEGLQTCRRCSLWRNATQAVEGEGTLDSRLILVGEQPGDEEDLRGKPFVGPAGQVLNDALDRAGLHRDRLFVTNAVKHFKWEPRGKKRLHSKPNVEEIAACNVWLMSEIRTVNPRVIVTLGATALRAVTGKTAAIDSVRGGELSGPGGVRVVATYHPSAILRADADRAAQLSTALIEDLRRAQSLVDLDLVR